MNAPITIRTAYSPRARSIAAAIARLCRWKIVGQKPADAKTVFLGVPHTSNWDLFYTLLTAIVLDIPIVFTIKDDHMRGPLGRFLAWTGGIPINRRQSTNTVEQIVDIFNRYENVNLVITPEGTRKRVKFWKTGFYWIALGAGAAIVPAFIDYGKRMSGVAESVRPTGDFEADFDKIASFYERQMGFRPQYDPAKMRPASETPSVDLAQPNPAQ